MTAKTELSAPKRRTRAEVQQLVAEFVNSGMRRSEVLPESRFELQHTASPSKETALEREGVANFLGWSSGGRGVGAQ